MFNLNPYIDLASELVAAWQKGVPRLRQALVAAIGFVLIAIVLVVLAQISVVPSKVAEPIAGAIGVLAAMLVLGVLAYQQSARGSAVAERIERAEKKVEEHPSQPQAAWELAQLKLETYLDRNLSQVRSIYWLTVVVMTLGFLLIGYGVLKVFANPAANLKASIVATTSGVLVNFIGATFLVVHRSTMSQAKEYVAILERINAVGMAVQILETIDDDENNLRQRTTAALATEMLRMYSGTTGKRNP
jgi:hypothetical protein